jgi:hypothetical protein
VRGKNDIALVEKLDCDKVGRVVRLLVRMLHELQADELGV